MKTVLTDLSKSYTLYFDCVIAKLFIKRYINNFDPHLCLMRSNYCMKGAWFNIEK